eukprot:m.94094 g.94094  ORF g.94094 m.94094 type:complete len:187 (+) comp12207_c0_seq4:830-1390(+)
MIARCLIRWCSRPGLLRWVESHWLAAAVSWPMRALNRVTFFRCLFPLSPICRCGSESTVNCLSALHPLGHLFSLEPPLESLQVKQLGRGVRNFDDAVWQANLMRIAEEVVTQKFQKVPGLSEVLLRTGGNLIAEAAPRDAIWGIGLGKADPLAMDPTQWRGTNVLGWALMRARGSLGGTGVPTPRK